MLAAMAGLPDEATAQALPATSTTKPAQAQDSAGRARVAGRIVRVTGGGDRSVARQWVILHGIGTTGGHAIDSTRTAADGSFMLRYDRGTDSTAQYFISTVHHGIAYVSGVLPPNATPDDATLTVFDTSSAAIPLTVRGRHLLVFAPADDPRRRVAEIYDLSNDTTVTRIATERSGPLWSAGVPAAAQDFSSGPEMLSNEAIKLAAGRVVAYAPVAPGLKRIAFTYALPPDAFPVSFPVEHPTDVFEILVEDREAAVSGPGLEESAPSSIEGRMFRRFQAQGMSAPSLVVVRVPTAPAAPKRANMALVVALGIVMAGALAVALRRARARPSRADVPPTRAAESDVDALAREIATLDAAFETTDRGDDDRARYQHRRDQLKAELAERLAARRGA